MCTVSIEYFKWFNKLVVGIKIHRFWIDAGTNTLQYNYNICNILHHQIIFCFEGVKYTVQACGGSPFQYFWRINYKNCMTTVAPLKRTKLLWKDTLVVWTMVTDYIHRRTILWSKDWPLIPIHKLKKKTNPWTPVLRRSTRSTNLRCKSFLIQF